MRFLLQVVLIAIGGFLAETVFPWWTVAVVAFIVTSLLPAPGFKSFLSGFLGIGLLWFIGALYFSLKTDYLLTEKVAQLMQVGSSGVVILVTTFIGALVGGMGALSGSQLYQLLKVRRSRRSRYHSSSG